MSILFRKKGQNWQPARELAYSSEAHLQKMLYDSPELIPVHGGEKVARVFIREAGLPGSGSTDLVGVDEKGKIYIVECKLATNPENRRKVIGQILEYAAYLWGMAFEDFAQLFTSREKKSLEQLLTEKVPAEWAYEEFRQAIAGNLESGSFHLFIAVDEINEELERIIAYLNRGGPGIGLQAIELNLYGEGEMEILVPELHGQAPEPPGTRGSVRIDITEPDFLKELGRNATPELVEFAKWVILRAKEHQLELDWKQAGPLLKYRDGSSADLFFTFGQLERWGDRLTHIFRLDERIEKEGLPREISRDYCDEVAALTGAKRITMQMKGKLLNTVDDAQLRKLAPNKEKWFAAIDRATTRIREAIAEKESRK
jgi:hypothetical protein